MEQKDRSPTWGGCVLRREPPHQTHCAQDCREDVSGEWSTSCVEVAKIRKDALHEGGESLMRWLGGFVERQESDAKPVNH